MATTVKLTTTVLPGGRIELRAPQLAEGQEVDVVIAPRENGKRAICILDFMRAQQPGPRSAKDWEEFERQFQEERNSWDR